MDDAPACRPKRKVVHHLNLERRLVLPVLLGQRVR
jgi:hypothetical protein